MRKYKGSQNVTAKDGETVISAGGRIVIGDNLVVSHGGRVIASDGDIIVIADEATEED